MGTVQRFPTAICVTDLEDFFSRGGRSLWPVYVHNLSFPLFNICLMISPLRSLAQTLTLTAFDEAHVPVPESPRAKFFMSRLRS
jgi:hypothetical protein